MNKFIAYLLLPTLLGLYSVQILADTDPAVLAYYCHQPEFQCVQVHARQTWEKLFPDPEQRELVMRLNRTDAELKNFKLIIVPRNLQQVQYMDLAPFPFHRNTGGHKLLLVSLSHYAFGVYNQEGNLIYWGPASGGKTWCDETNKESCATQEGEYKIFRLAGEDCVSKTYPVETNGGSSMPWCMFYFNGFSIHGSPTLGGFENRSHGCVRLLSEDAKWLNLHFVNVGTRVAIVK